MFAHCDVNAFYASCQTAFRPDLKGRPVVVLSNNDGCVIARSAEAKPFVKMGEPYFKQKAAFLRHGVVAFSSNYELYADMSSRVMATLEELTPRCEIYSIDEAFCDVSGVRHCRDLTDFGREIRATVLQRTHLTLGVGIAQTNTLAKLAAGIADTAVTMAAKAHLRNGRPVVLAVSTNDGLAGAAKNIGALMARKHIYFVPFRQDDPEGKPTSLVADMTQVTAAIAAALEGRQLQPVLLGAR